MPGRPLSVLVAVGLVLAPAPARARQECCAPVKVAEALWDAESGPSGYGVGPGWLAADGIGGVYAKWTALGDPTTLVVSRDDGTSWSAPIARLAGSANHFVSTVDPGGNLLVAYVDRGNVAVRVSHDQARTFSQERVVGAIAGTSGGFIALALGPTDVGVVAWTDSSWPTPTAHDGLWAAVSTDHGDSWSAPFHVNDGTGTLAGICYEPAAVVADSTAIVAWRDYRDQGSGVWSSRSTDGGSTWSANVLLEGEDASGSGPVFVALEASGGSHVHAVVAAHGGFRIHVHPSDDAGATWPDSGLSLTVNDYREDHATMTDGNGRIAIAWIDGITEARHLTVSDAHGAAGSWRTGAGTWAVPGFGVHVPGLASLPDGSLVIVHEDYRDDVPCVQPNATCESVYADRTCDDGDTWLDVETRLDEDAWPSYPPSELPLVAFSRARARVHAIWSDMQRPGSSLVQIHHAALEIPDVPDLDVATVASRASACEAPSYRLEAIVAAPGACNVGGYEWYEDGVLVPGAIGPTFDPPGPGRHAYRFRLACVPELACGATSPEVVVDQQPFAPPVASLTEEPSAGCGEIRHHLGATLGDLATTCSNVTFQWYEDGAAIPGAVSASFDVPPEHALGTFRFHAELRCEDAPPCELPTNDVVVEVVRPPGHLAGVELAGLLFVRKAPGLVTLSWTDASPIASGYHAYAGPIGTWYGHGRLACAIPRAVPPAARTETSVPMPPIDTYYLLVPADCGGEGAVGWNSLGGVRPQVAVGSPCGPI